MTAPDFAAQVLAGGLGEIGSAALSALYVAALAVGSYVMLIAVLYVLALAVFRRHRRKHPVITPPAEEVGDDTFVMLRQPQAAPWPDGDTVIDGGMRAELNEILKGDGRG